MVFCRKFRKTKGAPKMETLEMEIDVDKQAEDFAQAKCSFNWCDARIFDLQMARKLLDDGDPRETEINNTLDLLFAEKERLLALMDR
jgi:hypothetical protein